MPAKTRSFRKVRESIERTNPWSNEKIHWSAASRQASIPRDTALNKKIGIEKNDKVLFFAGCFGDWANAIAKNAQVHYTDASREMTAFASREPSEVKSFRARAGQLQPQRKLLFDWSVSFEPVPMTAFGTVQIKLALLRSLLNRKGAKIIYDTERPCQLEHALQKTIATCNEMQKRYGAEIKVKTAKIQTERGMAEHTIIDFLTNEKAREKAVIDIKVLRLAEKGMPIQEITKRTGFSEMQVKRALIRISRL